MVKLLHGFDLLGGQFLTLVVIKYLLVRVHLGIVERLDGIRVDIVGTDGAEDGARKDLVIESGTLSNHLVHLDLTIATQLHHATSSYDMAYIEFFTFRDGDARDARSR